MGSVALCSGCNTLNEPDEGHVANHLQIGKECCKLLANRFALSLPCVSY